LGYANHPGCLLSRELAVRLRHGGSGALQAATQRRDGEDSYPKENPGFWTRWRGFAQVKLCSNIQLLPYPV
jgi:hypothetical protein